MSARAAAGGAAALALALASVISQAVYAGAQTVLCPARPGNPVPAYPGVASLTPWLHWAPLTLLTAALIVLAICRTALTGGTAPSCARPDDCLGGPGLPASAL